MCAVPGTYADIALLYFICQKTSIAFTAASCCLARILGKSWSSTNTDDDIANDCCNHFIKKFMALKQVSGAEYPAPAYPPAD